MEWLQWSITARVLPKAAKQKAPIPQYVSCRFWQYHVSGSWRVISKN